MVPGINIGDLTGVLLCALLGKHTVTCAIAHADDDCLQAHVDDD